MAVQVSWPGVYIDEFEPGAPIQGVGTSTPVFLGIAEKGPINIATDGGKLIIQNGLTVTGTGGTGDGTITLSQGGGAVLGFLGSQEIDDATINLNPGGPGWNWGEGYNRRQHLLPMDLRNIRIGEGYIWLAGLNDPIPAMFPPYYDDPLRPELARRARANPYYRG